MLQTPVAQLHTRDLTGRKEGAESENEPHAACRLADEVGMRVCDRAQPANSYRLMSNARYFTPGRAFSDHPVATSQRAGAHMAQAPELSTCRA